MRQKIKSVVGHLYPINLIIREIKNRQRFHNEILLLNGKSRTSNTHQSILFFTTHKCASVYVGDILRSLAKDVGMTPVKIESYLTTIGKPKYNSQIEKEKLKKTFKPVGYLYGPFRTPPSNWEPPSMEAYRILLMLRDPRDVLTSLYFSVAYGHSIKDGKVGKKQLNSREKTLNKTIDEFVIDMSSSYLERYNEYCENLLGKSNTLFVKYEDMVRNFNVWLNTVMTVLELNASQELLNKIISEVDFNVPEENIYTHKRQVTPGDHKRKLQPETISILNAKFCKVLDLLGYAKE